MNLNYAYTPQIWSPVITFLVLIVLAVYSYRRRSVPGALPFTFALLFGALWAAGYVLEYLAVDQATKITWVKFQMAWQLPSAIAVAFFLLEYTWPGRWLTRRNLALLSIVPLLLFLLILTDHLHHLVWRGFVFNKTVTPLLGPVGWIAIVYGYSFTVVNFIVFAWLFLRSPQHRWAVVLIVISQIFLRAAYLLDKTQTIQSDLPLVVIGMAFVCLMYTVALFRFHFLSPLPLARQTVIDQMREGMVVLDNEGRVAGLNPVAADILGLPGKQAIGRLIREILPSNADQGDKSPGESEINLGKGSETRNYLLTTSLLKDWRSQDAGRLLLLHDVTEQKRAQSQLLEQQRALATLHERERLARELHDSIGQVLGYVSLQAQAIRRRAQGNDLPAVVAQLTRLAEVAQAAHADVRDSILSLNAGAGQAWSFQAALRQYLDAYSDQYGIRTALSLAEGWADGLFEPETEVQLLRVIQEALTNARKHGKPGCVQVTFFIWDRLARILIADDGVGFDPWILNPNEGGHYGLQFMRERAEQIGGRLQVGSAPGEGTKVVVEVPMKKDMGTRRQGDREAAYD